ncbi:hypothetical protein GUJ93_ZPchr0006g41356 [Zizania palustris]|uniref:Transcription factor MYC/MYB N-terminal domain-containing protein n=1 Tax=Zizania palustris TaxID=103762 RepID=A0A8J5T163_ZIZPA|nr:hypothetical protein GUJ93_ZPchr0006g41356 [Zizania palustris]
MEEQLSPVAVTHLLQHTLRSLCTTGGDASQWVYAVFWRILPRNYPPPKWDLPGGAYDRTRGNRRNWILAWEDGFCNFAATTSAACGQDGAAYADCDAAAAAAAQEGKQLPAGAGLQPELFFKMSHDIYNYGEGLIGKVAADHSHKWVSKEPQESEINLISSWSNPADSHPRTWEAQFQSGIQTIALIAVREGVVQLGSMKKVAEDLSYVVLLRRKFGYLESIPGVLLPHPSSAGAAYSGGGGCVVGPPDAAAAWPGMMPPELYVDPYCAAAGVAGPSPASMQIMPSMSSLEALLSKLPSVVPAPQPSSRPPQPGSSSMPPTGAAAVAAKEEADDDGYVQCHGMDMSSNDGGESTSGAATTLPSSYFVNVGVKPSEGF